MITVFLDRDGTLGGEGGVVHPFTFTLYSCSAPAIKLFNQSGMKTFLFTNQSGIGSGKFSEETFLAGCEMMHEELKKNEAFLDGVYYCPHKPEDHCDCRKPQTKLLEEAAKEYQLDLSQCYVVGDRLTDMLVAERAGLKKVLVRTGWGEKSLYGYHEEKLKRIKINFIADDVLKAAEWIVRDSKTKTYIT
ncbi:HAD family hydrolase [Sporolactobacillus sp. THM7-7]|nr:HAD family hydrolase [Sporolactobacillus sp. THM7-7]